jgi:D-ribose pyranase
MRDSGLWNAELVEQIAGLRHTELMVIADAGLPVPDHVRTIDLGWKRGHPRMLPVLEAVLGELVTERATIASEAADKVLLDGLAAALAGIPVERIPHEELKSLAGKARAVVRTGEDTPYANVVLHGGVPFPSSAAQTGSGVQ